MTNRIYPIAQNHPNYTGYKEISGEQWGKIKRSADKRNLDFLITKEEVWELYLKQNKKCALSGLDINWGGNHHSNRTASIDRIDNNKGYTLDNIQLVHKEINMMRWKLSIEEFKNICNIISERFKDEY